MRLRTLLVVLAVLLVAAFVALNWPAFVTPMPLNLLFTTVEAPPALIMLALLALALLAGAIYMAVWQSEILRESRRNAKELQAQRQLAEQAEASRVTELRSVVLAQTDRLDERLQALQELLRTEIRDNAGSIAAMVGELGDRRGGGASPAPSPAPVGASLPLPHRARRRRRRSGGPERRTVAAATAAPAGATPASCRRGARCTSGPEPGPGDRHRAAGTCAAARCSAPGRRRRKSRFPRARGGARPVLL